MLIGRIVNVKRGDTGTSPLSRNHIAGLNDAHALPRWFAMVIGDR
jgi:hypothetical protein